MGDEEVRKVPAAPPVKAPDASAPANLPKPDDPDDPDNRLVKITRVEPGEDGPATTIAYTGKGGAHQYWRPDGETQDFEVTAEIAAAAIESGHFTEAVDTKTRLRKGR